MTFQCEFPADNHSDDLVEVWHGATTPVVLCGYHVAQNRHGRIVQFVLDERARAVAAEKTPEQIAEIQRLRDDPRLP